MTEKIVVWVFIIATVVWLAYAFGHEAGVINF